MAPLTECPDCGKYYRGKRCACGYTTLTVVRSMPVTPPPAWQREQPPCTPEENDRALNLVKALMAQEITRHQAHLVLHALFQGRELPEGQTMCDCGIELDAALTPR